MSVGPELYCKVYLNDFGELARLRATLIELVGGVESGRSIKGGELVIDLFDHSKIHLASSDEDAFVTWPTYLEIEPDEGTALSLEEFARRLRQLLKALAHSGVRAVPACHFEELLEDANA